MTAGRRALYESRKPVIFAVALAASASAWAGGRPDDETRNWYGNLSGGWAFPEGDAGDLLDDDWMLSGGATYWPAEWPVGINFELTYASFDLSNDAIDAVNAAIARDPVNEGSIDGGDVETWQLTIGAIWGPGDRDNGLYLTGGVGVYDLKGTVTNTGLVYYPPFCDPWYWWWCVPGGVGPGSIVRGSESTTEVGYNLGIGYGFPMGGGQLFVEGRYHFINTDTEDMTYAPLTIGYRW